MNKIPVFVERDPDVIMAECKAKLQELLGRELQPAQVEQLMLQFIVYREVLLTNRFNAGMAQMLYQFSRAPILDYIAGLVAVERLPAAYAGCTVRFDLVDGHGAVLIPEGTRVATDDNVIFRTVDDVAIPDHVHAVEVKALADTAGKGANGYAPGTVAKILDPLAFVSTAANLDTTGGGSDVETDEQLRERIKLAPSQYSSAGSRSSYKFYATSANPLITDVSITSPTPGTVVIVPLTENDDTPEQIITDVYAACSPEDVRPLTDTVIVAAPTRMEYAIQVDVTLYDNADATGTQADITAALRDYAAEKRRKLGQDIIRSHIAQICRIGAVYDVAVTEPAENIVVTDAAFATCTEIAVNITGFNRG
ncbi:baseplate J/gp47 family protein [uncultured Rikenella sp.]|uniref:baseplate assembly protein n=1 Tax=uncultured Rikenella sp. TaxID=368003 RepID=UPI0025CCB717|nr:baseplate J/gp47 family protein [uncultured Rikenella sp.]